METPNKIIPFNDVSRRFARVESIYSNILRLVTHGPYLNGEFTQKFQRKFSSFIGIPYCVGVSSGTVALEMALASLSLPKNSRVVTAANAGGYGTIAINRNQLIPHYVDVDDNGLINIQSILDVSKEIKAVIVTHLYGQATQLESLATLLKDRGIFLIEDCAQAVGAFIGENRAGSVGDVSTFSFYPTKNLGSIGDSGAVCTSNPEIFGRLEMLREYGWSNRYFSQVPQGSNNRIDEIQALVLELQIHKVDQWNFRRREIWERYRLAARKSGCRLIGNNSNSFVAHLAVLDLRNRKSFINHLLKSGIETSIHYPYPDYVQPGLFQGNLEEPLRNTERLCSSVVSIPIFPELEEEEISRVEVALANYKE